MPRNPNRLIKIPLHNSLAVARAVVSRIRIPAALKNNVTLKSWANCREQGYHIWVTGDNINLWYGINVAECRNSDSIIVMHGPSSQFDHQTNQMSEQIYRSRENNLSFGYDERDKAARFIEKIVLAMGTPGVNGEKRQQTVARLVEVELRRQERKCMAWHRRHALLCARQRKAKLRKEMKRTNTANIRALGGHVLGAQ